MKKSICTVFVLLIFHWSLAQTFEDSRVIVTLSDSTDLYKKVKIALVNNNFVVMDNYNIDTLTTYPRSMENVQGYIMLKAIIRGNMVEFSGAFGLTRIDGWGYTLTPKYYQRVIYYKGSRTWKLMRQMAEKLGGAISYSK